jgi:hypothetical protein
LKNLEKLLSGGDLRSIGKGNAVAAAVSNRAEFDELFKYLFHHDRLVKMRAADALEKISAAHPGYLAGHKKELFELLNAQEGIELQWHLAQLIARVDLTVRETEIVWNKLSEWAMDKNQSRIVRVNSLQSLYDLSNLHPEFQNKFTIIINKIEKEQIPSILARIKKLRKQQPGILL